MVTPYIPVLDTNGEEWDRLERTVALDALVELIVQGEYSGIDVSKQSSREALLLRSTGSVVFEV